MVRTYDSQCRSRNCPGLGSIPASWITVESEGRQMKQCWISYIKIKKIKNISLAGLETQTKDMSVFYTSWRVQSGLQHVLRAGYNSGTLTRLCSFLWRYLPNLVMKALLGLTQASEKIWQLRFPEGSGNVELERDRGSTTNLGQEQKTFTEVILQGRKRLVLGPWKTEKPRIVFVRRGIRN